MMEKVKAKMKFSKMIESIKNSREDEFGCDDCFEFMDQFAEAVIEGAEHSSSETDELVKDHLEKCMDCGEIFTTYLTALRKAE